MITMTVRKHIERGGFHIDRFAAVVEGAVVVTSRQPAYDGARKLVELGHDPDEMVTVISPSGTAWPPQRLGALSRWTVIDSDRSGLARRKWAPFPTGAVKDGREP